MVRDVDFATNATRGHAPQQERAIVSAQAKAKYALHPGYVFTPDAKRIYVSAVVLALRYGLAAGSWIRFDPETPVPGARFSDYVHLYPQPTLDDYAPALAVAERQAAQRQQS